MVGSGTKASLTRDLEEDVNSLPIRGRPRATVAFRNRNTPVLQRLHTPVPQSPKLRKVSRSVQPQRHP